jgi:putative transposase
VRRTRLPRHQCNVSYYRRNLPHWQPEGASIFLTWCLHGTPGRLQPHLVNCDPGRAFLTYDRTLDKAASGPKWLQESPIARCVADALRFGEQQLNLYALSAFCLMPNHVHAVIQPCSPISRITKSIKGFTAREANRILGRTGERFWQDESYDHWIRNENEWNRIVRYTELNPVAAGLVETAEQWPWSSASVSGPGSGR